MNGNQPPKGLRRCHHPNLDSVVLPVAHGDPFKRAFVATSGSGKRTVAPHTHRTDIQIEVLRGVVEHYVFTTGGRFIADMHSYRTPLLGGSGLTPLGQVALDETKRMLHVRDQIALPHYVAHTVKWSFDAVWTVTESDVRSESTLVYVRTLVDEFDTTGLYQPMDHDEWLNKVLMVEDLEATA